MVCTARESKGWDEDTPQPPTLRFQTPFNVFSTRASDKADHEAWKYIHSNLHCVGPLEPDFINLSQVYSQFNNGYWDRDSGFFHICKLHINITDKQLNRR